MKRPVNYNTKQRDAVLAYIFSHSENHVTAAQIIAHFNNASVAIGRTTVYRLLEKLTASGEIRKFNIDGISASCFQYIDNGKECREHFHLKCESCGELIHFECKEMENMHKHIREKHDFKVDAMRTVLYGKCSTCQ